MKKYTDPNKNSVVVEVLKKVCSTVDPNAFIAGGYSAELVFGFNRGLIELDPEVETDVDIFFYHPFYDPFRDWGLDSDATKLLSSVFPNTFNSAHLEIYYYHYDIRRLGSMRYKEVNFDFIQYNIEKSSHDIINGFDLDECKATTRLSNYQTKTPHLITTTTPEFDKAWKTKEIKPHLDLLEYPQANEIQNEKTLKRARKWGKIKQFYLGN